MSQIGDHERTIEVVPVFEPIPQEQPTQQPERVEQPVEQPVVEDDKFDSIVEYAMRNLKGFSA